MHREGPGQRQLHRLVGVEGGRAGGVPDRLTGRVDRLHDDPQVLVDRPAAEVEFVRMTDRQIPLVALDRLAVQGVQLMWSA
jgi:hypothetical protein